MHKPGNGRSNSLWLVSGLLGLLPLAAMAVAPVVDTKEPIAITGYADPLTVDATLPIYILDLETKIGTANPAVIVVDDEVDGTTPTSFPSYNFSPTGSVGPLIPGQYEITWKATDLGFNSLTETQTLNVLPSIDLEVDQTVGEGGTAVVTAHLSGKAPSYPVTIPYTVVNNGTTSAADHGAVDGDFVFTADTTEASISFTINNDADSGEGETFNIELGALPAQVFADADHKTIHTITITETNLAPLAQLQAKQGGNVVRAITADGGTVTVCAMPDCGNAYDANGDSITYDWSASDNALAPTLGTTGNSFTFEPDGLTPGYYTVRLTVTDDGGLSSSHELFLRLFETTPTLSDTTDSDSDTLMDDVEGILDNDGDGIPNYLDAVESNPTLMQGYEPYVFNPNLIVGATMVVDSITLEWSINGNASPTVLYPLLITTEPGHEAHLGPTVFAASRSYARITSNTAEALRGADLPDGIVSSDGQVIDIEITNLSKAGGTAKVIVPQVAPIPSPQSGSPEFIVFSSAKVWDNFSTAGSNQIKTTNKTNSYCPNMGNTASYLDDLISGAECLLITIEDGGPNDYDGVANGSIRLMGGVFISSASVPLEQTSGAGTFSGDTESSVESLDKLDLGSGGGGGSLDLLSLFGLLLTPLLRRQARKNQ